MTTAQSAQQRPSPAGPASLAARLTARLVDLTIKAAIGFAAYVMAGLLYFSYGAPDIGFAYHPVTDQEAYVSFAPFLAVPLYRAATIATTAWRGITPGKRLLGIQVVARSDSLPPTAMQAIVRWAVPLVPLAPLVDAFIRDIPELANDWEAPALSGRVWWLWVALGWWLLVHVPAMWDRDRRGWHDRASDTVVVEAR